MRQAGRYHKHYQNLRAKYSFSELCKIPEVAAEVAFGPVNEFDFDLAILFSDLLFPLEGLGMGLEYTDSGPKLGWYLTEDNFKNLKTATDAIEFMQFQKEAMKLTRERIPKEKSLIGFVGGSWTLFTYASMNKHDGSLTFAKSSPSLRAKFLPLIEEILIQNISLQLEGGAEVVMILDTAAGELSPNLFNDIVIPFVKKATERFPNKIGYYAKNATEGLIHSILAETSVAGVGFDHRLNFNSMIQSNQKGFTQGNFDQSLLFLETDEFKKELNLFIQRMKVEPSKRLGWVCGLGHGILPKTPESHVKYFVDKIREEFEK
jgi:uroporphyrinogen decarboxylase